MKSISIRPKDGGFVIEMWFYGRVWHLMTAGTRMYWCIRANNINVWTPLRHPLELDSCGPRRMLLAQDGPMSAVEVARKQIMRLRYHKPTPTFHEQYVHHFSPTP